MEEKNPIQVSERIFHTIECLAKYGPMGLLELSKELNLNKSTVHRILNSLIFMDYVKQDPETSKYSLSFKFCHISNQILAQNNMIDIARPYIKELAEQTGETVHLVQMDGINAVYIDKVEASKNSVRLVSMVGKSIPLYCSGVGKALLADMSDDKIQHIWEQSDIRKLTDYTVTDFDKFKKIIASIRKDGYSLDNEENELGVRCIAVSLKDYRGKSHYAISISAPKDRMSDEQLKNFQKLILQIKDQIQWEMGQRH
ncbi:IclR family transcriptional regulator [Bariatricus sp. SGI.154]|uniref:IclR family transcriptional regulator n=1 Tax=Bariatricus sp. SGI.154 TaxID=3420549 RepID=UPI003D0012D8